MTAAMARMKDERWEHQRQAKAESESKIESERLVEVILR
jgi:hypothetical protein